MRKQRDIILVDQRGTGKSNPLTCVGADGYVEQHLAEFAPNPATDIAYLCGNPDMVDATFEALKDAGLPTPQVRREKYVSSK